MKTVTISMEHLMNSPCGRNTWYGKINETKLFFSPSAKYGLAILFFKSLFYNDHNTWGYFVDTIFWEPFTWFINKNMKFLGPLFVIIIFAMLLIYVVIAYVIGIPYWYERSPNVLCIAFIIGHWLLLNVTWNYWNALCTSPGYPSDKKIVKEAVTFCRKCIQPKPPRTHHCSVCKKCILKMDHHCPWLNNCIGFYNHRYFFLFCLYTWFGTIFVMAFGVWVAIDYFFPKFTIFEDFFFHDPMLQEYNQVYYFLDLFEISTARLRYICIIYEFIVTVLLFFLLGLLLRYHIDHISNGETCIERHINNKSRKHFERINKTFRNPYDFGFKTNWKIFLGLEGKRNPLLHILLPSYFTPSGDGFTWKTQMIECNKSSNCLSNMPTFMISDEQYSLL